ncbi:hypothetical protein GCK32_002341 [Trichostrongylus colubriformis]|uniref:Uncharacterized protein n=1 Tax=Trichostrongylus colubriformis TaxID=6319 RepID=A0AAN8ENE4_TRICO
MTKQPNVVVILFTVVFLGLVNGRTLTQEEWNALQATYVLPNSAILLHALVFIVVVLLLLYPPDAFVGAGVTFDNLAYAYLGSSDANILDFFCRRYVLTRAFIASLPYLLVLSLYFTKEHAVLFTSHPTRVIHYVALISPVLAIGHIYLFDKVFKSFE